MHITSSTLGCNQLITTKPHKLIELRFYDPLITRCFGDILVNQSLRKVTQKIQAYTSKHKLTVTKKTEKK